MKNYLSKDFFDLTKQFIRKMRTTCLMILVFTSSLFASNVNSQVAKVSIAMKNAYLIEVIRAIESQTDYLFVYDKNEIDLTQRVDLIAENKSVVDILSGIFSNTNIVYAMEGNNIMLMLNSDIQQQQQKTVSGKVTDSNGAPLPGVSVVVKGTTIGTITNSDGKYSLSNLPANSTLQFSFIGMKIQEIVVADKATINISMQEESIGIDEVVAIGYGTQHKRDLTSAIGSVSESTITERPTSSNILQALGGKVAGVNVMTNSGQPGGSPVIKIRGVGSINSSNTPLYVVDGVVDIDPSTIDPNIISTVDILKDAGAASIYGSKGANGVVVITTLKGNKNSSNISFNNTLSFGNMQHEISVLDANGALEMFKREYEYVPGRLAPNLDANNNFTRKNELFNSDGTPIYNTDWQKACTRLAVSHSHSLTFSKSKDDFTTIANLSVRNDEGIMLNSYAKQINGFVKINWDANPWLNIQSSISIGGSQSQNALAPNAATGSDLRPMYYQLPFLPIKYKDGTFSRNSDYPGADPTSENPVKLLENIKNVTGKTYARGNIIGTFHFMNDLDFTSSFSGQTATDYLFSYAGTGLRNISEIQNGVAKRTNIISGAWTNEDYFTYKKSFRKTQLNLVMGASWYYNISTNTFAGSQNFFDNAFSFNSLQAGSVIVNSSSDLSSDQFNSYYARLHYVYDDRFILDGSYRIDGSSRFGANNKYAKFPSISGAWNISKESFFKGISSKIVNNLKIRASYGFVGNAEIGDYVTLARLVNSQSVFNYDKSSAVTLGSVQNNNLTWEKSRQFDIGLDADFFNNRVQLTVDFYNKRTEGLLYNKTIPITTGYSTAIDNIGSIQNKGFEFTLQTINISSQHGFKWNTNFNFSLNRNKVLALNEDILYGIFGTTRIMEGHPLNEFYGYVRLGVWGTNEAAEAAKYGEKPGDMKYADLDKNGVINSKDQTDLGNGMPKCEINMTNTFSYKNLSLYIDLESMIGLKLLNFLDPVMLNERSQSNAFSNILNDSWTTQNQQVMIPQLRLASDPRPYPLAQGDSYFVEDGTFLRVRNIALTYKMKANWLGIKQIRDLSIGANVENAFLFTKYTGSDPEFSTLSGYFNQGYDNGQYPKPRTFTFSLKVNF